MIGVVLCGATALALIGIGVGALLAPHTSAGQYGIAVADPRALAYLRAMGVRDLVLGIVLALMMAAGSTPLLAASVAACALVALADFALVLADPAPASAVPVVPRGLPLALHAGGAIGLVVTALLVALGV